jgi:two-component system chemotaxis sensor kinase CheA
VKFRTKLYLGFGAVLFLILLMSLYFYLMLTKLNDNANLAVRDNYAKVELAMQIREEVAAIDRDASSLVFAETNTEFQRHLSSIDSNKYLLSENWKILSNTDDPDLQQIMADITGQFSAYSKSLGQVISMLQGNQKDQALDFLRNDTSGKQVQLFQGIDKFVEYHENKMELTIDGADSTYRDTIELLILMILAILVSGAIIAGWVFRSVTGSLLKVSTVMEQVDYENKGEFPRLNIPVKDEIGRIASSFNRMAESLEYHQEQVDHHVETLRTQSLHKEKIAEITSMYQGVRDLSALAEKFLNETSPLLSAGYAAFYAVQDYPKMKKMASYATNGGDPGVGELSVGEGLVGQCAKENKRILLSDIPHEYIQITTGIVSAAPRFILLEPVAFEGMVVGVVEYASLTGFSQGELGLLDELADTLGIAVNNIQGFMQIQNLLKDSQQFTEELQSQSEEMQLQQEELRTLNEKLEDNNRQLVLSSQYKSEFLANVSHELRTPLNSLLILAQMLADNREGNLLPKQLEHIRTIYSSGKDLLSIINEILDLSKIESGKMTLVYEDVSIKELADFADRHFRQEALNKGVEFLISLDPVLAGISIHTDIQKLQQVLKNLLANAMKFTERGSVALSFGIIESDEVNPMLVPQADAQILAISVKDTGIGISKSNQEIIFEAFQQADGTTSRRYGGTGLGLSICKEIAELLGGVITVDSELGTGSTFTLYLPHSTSQMALLGPQEAAAAIDTLPSKAKDMIHEQVAGKSILLVDDDMRNIYVLITALETYGMRVVFAENGQEAIDMLVRTPAIDLILMDIMMPTMDGFEAIKKIRSLEAYAQVPIIALTAKAMKNDREACIEAGANDYISKPIQLEQLLSLMAVWLHR